MLIESAAPLIATAATLIGLAAAVHALFNKRDPRSALSWCAVCLMAPFIGALLYGLFGINRVVKRVRRLQLGERRAPQPQDGLSPTEHEQIGHLAGLIQLSAALQQWPLTEGNRVTPLHNGEAAYPDMLAAIEQARIRISLGAYIFDGDGVGLEFIEALVDAARRGVDVRVLIDGVGAWYSWPRATGRLRRRGVPVRVFAPPKLLPPTLQINLRNHRKILVTDGEIGFAGGLNIGDRHRVATGSGQADVHFRFEGPVVGQLEEVFFEDWERAGGSRYYPLAVQPEPLPNQDARCRVLTDSPSEDMDKLTVVMIGAIALARQRVLIMNPYFLPPRELIGALVSAALRGVEVAIILPARSNLPFVHWATRNMLWEVLRWGVKVYYQPEPFNHSKLFVVDEDYVQVGSANLDPRSLRLNFELMVEVFDRELAHGLAAHCLAARGRSREVTLDEVDGRAFSERLRDAIAWLFSPYL